MIGPRLVVGALLLAAACSKSSGDPSRDRDFVAHPAIAVQSRPAARVWAVSDIHGGYDRLVALLQGNHLIDADRRWTGGDAHLYVLGDMIDKSTGGLATIRFLQGLETQAAAEGGEVVVTMGNHELEFLADPFNNKSAAFVTDLVDAGLDPKAVADGADVGAWMAARPFGVSDGDWFFSHAGNTAGRSLSALAGFIELDFQMLRGGGPALLDDGSLLEAELWWLTDNPAATADANLTALPAKHLVFGHDPAALETRGSIGQLLSARLFLIDTGMSPIVNDSQGAMLLIERSAGATTASAAFPVGEPGPIFYE